ncbi:MAG: ABC transporter permease [Verrucomicrobiota bacterium]|nr:ABC transporter permease [Verrucomicrobiota bacterium]
MAAEPPVSSSASIPRRVTRPSLVEWFLTLPPMLWLVLFFLVPTLLVCAISFHAADPAGGIQEGWSLDTWRRLMQPSYPAVIWRTVWVSLLATVVCLALAVPIAYFIARLKPEYRQWYLLLIILPFWTNFLIRIYAWKTLLHPEGFIKQTLVAFGMAHENTQLLYNVWAIIIVTIYTYLPFAILPLYAAAQKFDFQLLDAARDLGANQLQAFFKVFIPGINRGLLTALLVTLIPALGSYAIPDIVGGPTSELIGNKIVQRVYVDRNLPHAAAISAVLALAVLLPVIIGFIWQSMRRPLTPKA